MQPGDRVALLLDNSFDYVCAHFGVLKAGAVDVSLNTELKADGLHELLLDCEAKVLIAETRLLLGSVEALNGLPDLQHVLVDRPLKGSASLPSFGSDAYVCRTSLPAERARGRAAEEDGRRSRVARLYLRRDRQDRRGSCSLTVNLVSNAHSVVQYLGLGPQDRMMVVLPFYYIYGRSLLYTHFLSGGSLVIDNRFAYPAAILNTMQEQEVTCLAGVPTTYSILLNRSDLRARQFPHLRFVTQAGGGMSKACSRRWPRSFTRLACLSCMGRRKRLRA